MAYKMVQIENELAKMRFAVIKTEDDGTTPAGGFVYVIPTKDGEAHIPTLIMSMEIDAVFPQALLGKAAQQQYLIEINAAVDAVSKKYMKLAVDMRGEHRKGVG